MVVILHPCGMRLERDCSIRRADPKLKGLARYFEMFFVPAKVVVQKRIDPNASALVPRVLVTGKICAVPVGIAHEAAVLVVDGVLVHKGQAIFEEVMPVQVSELFARQTSQFPCVLTPRRNFPLFPRCTIRKSDLRCEVPNFESAGTAYLIADISKRCLRRPPRGTR